jgi:hypothetical protein
MCQQAVRAAGITKKASMHTLRHSYTTHLLEGGTDLATLQKLLGHNQLSTTVRYTHFEQSHLQRAGSPLGIEVDPCQAEPALPRLCPVCGGGGMVVVEVVAAWPRADGEPRPDSS